MEDQYKIYENKKQVKYACKSIIIFGAEKQISKDTKKLNEHQIKREAASSSWSRIVRGQYTEKSI